MAPHETRLPLMTPAVPAPQHTVAELLDAYTRDFLPRKAPKTQYQEQLLFRRVRADLGTIPLDHLSPLVLRSWFGSFQARWQPNTLRRYMTALSAVLTAAVEEYEWLPKHPLRKVRQPLKPPPRERCLEQGELASLLAACQRSRNQHLYLVVVLALSTGARKNELLQRTWADLDLVRGTLRLVRTKNGERRAVPLVGPALDLLRQQVQHAGACPWVFPRRDEQKPVFIDYAWWQACDAAGLEDFHFHDLRHTAGSFLAMSGASLREIAEILGHKTLTQTMKYTHLVEPHTRGVLARMVAQQLDAALQVKASRPEELTPAEAAACLGLSPKTLEQYRRLGGGPRYRKQGRWVRYTPSDLDAWLQSRTRTRPKDPGPAER